MSGATAKDDKVADDLRAAGEHAAVVAELLPVDHEADQRVERWLGQRRPLAAPQPLGGDCLRVVD